jgi:predicted nucleic acid-binding protein
LIVDASIWVGAELESEPDHYASLEWRDRQIRRRRPLFIPRLALTEVARAVARVTGNPARGAEAAQRIRRYRNLTIVEMDEALMDRATRLAAQLRLRGADAVYVALADRRGLPLVTWDREVGERAGRIVRVKRPG